MKYSIKIFLFTILALFICANTIATTTQAEQYCAISSVKASHILVDTIEEAELLKSKIDNGESFETLAKKYSKCPSGREGGDLGYFRRGEMVREFENASFDLPIGQVSEPVRTNFGWHLIKVYDKK